MQEQSQISYSDNTKSTRTKATTSPFDYNEALQAVISYGKQLIGPSFRIFEEDRATVLKLCSWFLRDEVIAAEEGLSLHKGILLTGPIGCGKSALMKILCACTEPAWKFVMKSSLRTALEFGQEGYTVIDRYTARSYDLHGRPRSVCFDDLGCESNIPNYGIPFNTLAEILSIRYELFVEDKMFTHITTNLNADELEERYGARLRSRMSEMFNLVAFPGPSPDKRKL
ncbi:hypothetical protein [uncultured Chitinophaga sp.]|jgi:DNA replication protein|uniref:hypothetical protein n=1 Tax=uncultured Chitinophaga sp. TaxID=339340 RepID=UPI00262B2AD2|nr:hypothetical protein [uncultured Chitinophaga sp.]